MRSDETIESLSDILVIASITSGATVKPSWLINLAARIIRSGSSEKESSGLPGVLNTFFAKSSTPLNKSINSGVSPVSSSAIAFTVKSLRAKSPSIESPKSTSGLRDVES